MENFIEHFNLYKKENLVFFNENVQINEQC